MAKLQTLESVVLSILEQSIIARKDDYVLIYLVCDRLNPNINDMPFGMAMYHHKEYQMPSWETITRCRRKIQAKRPDLVDSETARNRHEEEKDYIAYARS